MGFALVGCSLPKRGFTEFLLEIMRKDMDVRFGGFFLLAMHLHNLPL